MFAKDTSDDGEARGWATQPPAGTIPMPVPAAFNEITEDPDLRDYFGVAWYFVRLEKPDDSPVHKLRFGAAVYHAGVYLNGEKLHQSHLGKLPFEVDLSGKWQEGDNLLAVRIDTRLSWQTVPPGCQKSKRIPDINIEDHQRPEYHFDFLNNGGLLRSVWLLSLPANHLTGITLKTLSQNDQPQGWELCCQATGSCPVQYRILDAKGHEVANANAKQPSSTVTLHPEYPHLWSPDSPYLYSLEITLGSDDRYKTKIGLRCIRVVPDAFLLNGSRIYLRGCATHEDFHLVGQGHNDARLVRDLTMLKNMGANSFRTAHYPYDESAYRLADELGLLVIDETAAVGFNSWTSYPIFSDNRVDEQTLAVHKDMLVRLIERDHMHPSVVMWSIANEPACYEAEAEEYFRQLFELCRASDPECRPTTVVQSSWPESNGKLVSRSAQFCDVICYNRYAAWYFDPGHLEVVEKQSLDEPIAWRQMFPDKPVMITEFGADAIAGMHSSPPVMFSEEYQKETIAAYTRSLDKLSYVVGEHVWNMCDFMTKQGTVRVMGNRKGVHTRDRQPKLAAHFLKERWRRME